mmetsp:Transcript_20472/g.45148  ORF Transcript_20472/g.45148 Transcript_20472/m.45148 type:complete len:1047 (-) Transcript_20472:145-3285(-)
MGDGSGSSTVIPLADLNSAKSITPKAECVCVGDNRPDLGTVVRPADYGKQCAAHDAEQCGEWFGTQPGVGDYCCSAWCYVDPEKCAGSDGVFSSSVIPGAMFSYAVCQTTGQLAAADKETCLNKYGPDACYCTGNSLALNAPESQDLQNAEGMLMNLKGGLATDSTPGYGTKCYPWDKDTCSQYYPNEGDNKWDTWCCRSWCYVNPSCPTASRSWLVNETTHLYFAWDACADDPKDIETCPYQRSDDDLTGCECLGSWPEAKYYNNTAVRPSFAVDEYYGSQCGAWDRFSCEKNYGFGGTDDWCCADWCWVSPQCKSARASRFFQDRYFSYDACQATDALKAANAEQRLTCQFGPGRYGKCECLGNDPRGWHPDNQGPTEANKTKWGWISDFRDEYGWDCFPWDDATCDEKWGRRPLPALKAENAVYDHTAKTLTFSTTEAHGEIFNTTDPNITITFTGLSDTRLLDGGFPVKAITETSFVITVELSAGAVVNMTGGSAAVELPLPEWCCNDWCFVSPDCPSAKPSDYWDGLWWSDHQLACGREGEVKMIERYSATQAKVTLAANHSMLPADAVNLTGIQGDGWAVANTEVVLKAFAEGTADQFLVDVVVPSTPATIPPHGAVFELTQTFTQTTCDATEQRMLEEVKPPPASEFSRRRGASRRTPATTTTTTARRRAPVARRRAPETRRRAPDVRRRAPVTPAPTTTRRRSAPTQIEQSTAVTSRRRRTVVVVARRRRTTTVTTPSAPVRRRSIDTVPPTSWESSRRRRSFVQNSQPYYGSTGHEVGVGPGKYQQYYSGLPYPQPYGYSGYHSQRPQVSTSMAFGGGAVAGAALGYYMGTDRRRRWTRRRCVGSRRRFGEVFGEENGPFGYGNEDQTCEDEASNPYDDFCVCAQGGNPPPQCTLEPMPCDAAMKKYGTSVQSAESCGVVGCRIAPTVSFSRDDLLAYNFMITKDTVFPLNLTITAIANPDLLSKTGGQSTCPSEPVVIAGQWIEAQSNFQEMLFVQLTSLVDLDSAAGGALVNFARPACSFFPFLATLAAVMFLAR